MITPALLTDKIDQLQAMLDLCASFTDYVQVDIMDGKFVSSSSVSLDDLNKIKGKISGEAHLMVNDPLPWLSPFKKLGATAIVYHFEISADHKNILKTIKSMGMKAGIAVNPDTKIEEFEYLIKELDSVLFMSVIPGFYGAAFIPDVLKKIKDFKARYPQVFTAIDGGVKSDNFSDILDSGVDMICVGSAILKNPNPALAYKEFVGMYDLVRSKK